MKHDLRDEATRYIWVVYGIVQAIITMCMAFDVVEGTTLISVVTAVALVLYVAANELLGRPLRRKPTLPHLDDPPQAPAGRHAANTSSNPQL